MGTYWVVILFVFIIVADILANKVDSDLTLTRNIRRIFNTWPEKISLNLFLLGLCVHFDLSSGKFSSPWFLALTGVPAAIIVVYHNVRKYVIRTSYY